MQDHSFNNVTENSYVVACSVDIAPAVSVRLLNYSRTDTESFDYADSPAEFTIAGDNLSTCQPLQCVGDGPVDVVCKQPWNISQFLTDTALATGAAASLELLTERQYVDGWWPTLYYFTWNNDESTTWNNSRNTFEDGLGLASAIALGMYWGSQMPGSIGIAPAGNTSVNGVRVGPGSWWAAFYVLPSAFSIVLLTYLFVRTRKS